MESFPDLALVNIFKKLDYRDRRSCSKVCRKWRHLIDHDIGKRVYLGKGNKKIWDKYTKHFQSIKTITEIGISDCTVSGEIGEEIPKFKYPHLVNSIEFDSVITVEHVDQLVKDLTNLRKLKFRDEFLHGDKLEKLSLAHPKLKTFELYYLGMPDKDKEPLTWNPIQNIIQILNLASFPELQNLCLIVPWCRQIEELLFATVFSFIGRHKENLRTLQISFFYMIKRPKGEYPLGMNPLPSMSDFGQIQLRKFDMTSNYGRMSVMDDYCADLLAEQRNLRFYKTIECSTAYSFPTPMIQNNAKTLVRIEITFNSEFCPLLDCVLTFGECTSLKVIYLCNYNDKEENFEGARITGLNGLPKSLESIQFYSLRSKENLTTLAIDFPNLKTFILDRTVGEDGHGVSVEAVVEILKEKRMAHVYFDYHKDLPKEFLSSLKKFSESLPILKKILKDATYRHMIYFHLENGIYKMGPSIDDVFGLTEDFPPHNFCFKYPPPYSKQAQLIAMLKAFVSAVGGIPSGILRFLGFLGPRRLCD